MLKTTFQLKNILTAYEGVRAALEVVCTEVYLLLGTLNACAGMGIQSEDSPLHVMQIMRLMCDVNSMG